MFYLSFKKTALFMAVEVENQEIVRLLLEHEEIDINAKSILTYINLWN